MGGGINNLNNLFLFASVSFIGVPRPFYIEELRDEIHRCIHVYVFFYYVNNNNNK
jgi:hypothetical protein